MATKIVYLTRFPNGKIYVGQDLTNNICYFGSMSSELVARDFSDEERMSFTVTREILWKSETATNAQVNAIEVDFIRKLNSNNPDIGYNRWPKFSQNASNI